MKPNDQHGGWGAWGNTTSVGVSYGILQPSGYTFLPSSRFSDTLEISLCLFGLSGCICTHTSIKVIIPTLQLQSELIKMLTFHNWVPQQLLNLCVFRICSYFSSLLRSNRSFNILTTCWEEKAAATLVSFNKSSLYLAFLGRSIYSKCLSMYSKCPVPVLNTAGILTWMALKGLVLRRKQIEKD